MLGIRESLYLPFFFCKKKRISRLQKFRGETRRATGANHRESIEEQASTARPDRATLIFSVAVDWPFPTERSADRDWAQVSGSKTAARGAATGSNTRLPSKSGF